MRKELYKSSALGCMSCLSLLFISSLSAQAASDQELVDQFYPERLALEAKKIDPTMERESDFELADLDRSGSKNYIIAAYSNTLSGAVRVLKKQGTTAVLVAEPNLPALSGFLPDIRLIDLDNDKIPEAIVSFSYASGNSSDWYFKWKSPNLEMIGPTATNSRGLVVTRLSNSSPVDLFGTGVLAIVDGPHESRPRPGSIGSNEAPKIYTLENGRYVYSTSKFFSESFVRKNGAPSVQKKRFTVDDVNSPYVLRIVNGGLNGAPRVSSAEIVLNGQTIVGPNKFSKNQAIITVPVTLTQAKNEISVTLKSVPGSMLFISLESKR